MSRNYDVVIVGAGVIGLSIAYYLKRKGAGRILVLEKEESWVAGSSALANGGIRQQFSTPINIRLTQISLPVFENFEEEVGADINLRQYGYLFVTATEENEKNLRKNATLQKEHGVPVDWLTVEEIAKLAPFLRLDDLIGGAFCAKDGYADSYSIATGYGNAARKLGVDIEFEQEVIDISVASGRIEGLKTQKMEVQTNVVVNAAGPFAVKMAELVGVEIPVVPLRHMVILTEEFPAIPERIPMTIDSDAGVIIRKEGERCYMGWADPDERPGFNTSFDPDWIDKTMERAIVRMPILEDIRINPKRCQAGLFAVSPDNTCILGEVPEVPGFYLANGFSGHGMMHAPAVGLILADLVTDGKTDLVDARLLRLARFREGDAIKEKIVQ